MVRVTPRRREELAELEPVLQLVEAGMGFLPNSLFALARRPAILRGFAALAGSVLGPGALEPELKQLVAYVASRAAGCRYCQAHTAHGAARAGADAAKVEHAFEFETHPAFDDRERAALALARDAAAHPPAVVDGHFEALRRHFDEDAIVELVAVVALFGFLNRFNDTMATTLEEEPLAFARARLAASGWEAGPHAPEEAD